MLLASGWTTGRSETKEIAHPLRPAPYQSQSTDHHRTSAAPECSPTCPGIPTRWQQGRPVSQVFPTMTYCRYAMWRFLSPGLSVFRHCSSMSNQPSSCHKERLSQAMPSHCVPANSLSRKSATREGVRPAKQKVKGSGLRFNDTRFRYSFAKLAHSGEKF